MKSRRLLVALPFAIIQAWWAPGASAMPDPGVQETTRAYQAYQHVAGQGHPAHELALLKACDVALKGILPEYGLSTDELIQKSLLEAEDGHSELALTTLTAIEQPPKTGLSTDLSESQLQARFAYAQGRVQAYLKNLTAARQSLSQSISLDPKLSQAKVLLGRVEAGLGPCDRPFPELTKLTQAQLYSCVKKTSIDDPNLNMQLFLLGESHNNAYVTTISPFLTTPAHHAAAVHALGKIMTWQQTPLLEPYLNEDPSVLVMIKVLTPARISPAMRARLGATTTRLLLAPQINSETRLSLIRLAGVLRYRPALPAFKRLQTLADALIRLETGTGNLLEDRQLHALENVDYANLVAEALAVARKQIEGQ